MSDTPKTKRVRVLVAMDDEGKWTSMGYSRDSDGDLKEWIMLDELGLVFRYSWIEADIPLPEPEQTIVGAVTEDVK